MNEDNNNLPKGWIWTNLSSIAKIIMGQSPPSSTYNTHKDGLPFFQGKAEFGELFPEPVKYCISPKKIAENNDILISVRAPVGPTNLANRKCCIGRGLAAIRASEGVQFKLLLYYLRSIESELSKIGQGSTFTAINKHVLHDISILLPPSAEQKRIVRKIESLFIRLTRTKEELAKIPPILKKFRQSVLAEAFSGELTEDIRKNDIEHIWQRKKLKDICEDVKSVNPYNYPERIFKYIDISSISNTTNEVTELKEFVGEKAPSRARRPMQKNDILFSNVRTYLKNIAQIKFEDSNLLCSTGFCVLRPKSMVRSDFLFYRILSDEFVENATTTQTGTHYPATSDKKVLSMEILLPPLNEQEIIIQRIKKAFTIVVEVAQEYKIAVTLINKLFSSILTKAFRGELVPQDPNDVPASILLERIKAAKMQSEAKSKNRMV